MPAGVAGVSRALSWLSYGWAVGAVTPPLVRMYEHWPAAAERHRTPGGAYYSLPKLHYPAVFSWADTRNTIE